MSIIIETGYISPVRQINKSWTTLINQFVATKTRVSPAWMLERSDDRELPKLQVTH